MVHIIEPIAAPSAEPPCIAIVAARFTKDICDILVADAISTLKERGLGDDDITVAWVPGAFELPLICDTFAFQGVCDGIIAFGCVIRGETTHYDYVCEGATRGILGASLDHGIPIILGVLTTENREQAMARADGTKCRKGVECAEAVLSMLGTMKAIEASAPVELDGAD